MLSTDYRLYVDDVIALSRSLVVKSVQTIEAQHKFLRDVGLEVDVNPVNWKYYINLAGEYYQHGITWNAVTDDTMMYVRSLDTLTEIPFEKTVLENHPLTRAEFKTFGKYYKELVAKYPSQEDLIRRILNPIDKTEAIAAKDHEILYFDSRYIDPNEINLISQLQDWIYRFQSRWNVTSYVNSDPLYPAAYLGILFLGITTEIINIRLENCKTPFVSQFHLWQYLGGFFRLDRYRGAIFHQQALFLYRNMEYILQNAGKRETLEFLNEGFAKPFGLELYTYDLRQDSENLLVDKKNEITLTRTPFGAPNIIDDVTTYITIEELQEKLIHQGILNLENKEIDAIRLRELMQRTPEATVATGVIECNVIKNGTQGIINEIFERYNQWFYLASKGLFPYKFNLNIPGKDPVLVSAAEAAVILLYCADRFQTIRAHQKEPGHVDDINANIPFSTEIPVIKARSIMHQPDLIETDFQDRVESKYLYITGFVDSNTPVEYNRYEIMSSDLVVPIEVETLPEFIEHVQNVLNRRLGHELLVFSEPNDIGRSQLRAAVDAFYRNIEIGHTLDCEGALTQFTTWADFFSDIQLDISDLKQIDYATIAVEITNHLVGFTQSQEGLASPYFEMMEILRILSSYTVMFIAGSGNAIIEPMDWVFLLPRFSQQNLSYNDLIPFWDMDVREDMASLSYLGETVPIDNLVTTVKLDGLTSSNSVEVVPDVIVKSGVSDSRILYGAGLIPGDVTVTINPPPP